ncbi:hypothetical protein ACFS27_03160 [Promicromonospora vindobonensis]|uniref:Uncharacterized protein n=1 Tax=Promicromonospora vindobonensis TaxID=195748 RepID=A0ABW5VNM0_9MICO
MTDMHGGDAEPPAQVLTLPNRNTGTTPPTGALADMSPFDLWHRLRDAIGSAAAAELLDAGAVHLVKANRSTALN